MKRVYFGVLGLCLALALALTGCGKDTVTLTLLPEDADLSYGPDLIVEPNKAPFNLGNWLDGNYPEWTVEIPETGMYNVAVEYSRPGGWDSVPATVYFIGEVENKYAEFTARATGGDTNEDGSDDWSVYTVADEMGLSLEAGTYIVSVESDYNDLEWETGYSFFINLRSVTLTLED